MTTSRQAAPDTPTQFRKVLIANRGEIAVRIERACRELGLSTVAIYSDVDRDAMHVRYATEAYRVGSPPPRESYLRLERIIEIARRSGAEAIHPGYGFLAENAEFAQACHDEGIAFIGPTPHAIERMGDKVVARRTVLAAGVPVVPGTDSERDLTDDELQVAATGIGYPVLIKAAAGGGGKGMRKVHRPEDFEAALQSARREAESAFGDGRVYVEKLVENARHIEIQVMADTQGNTIYLGERECSIQRRHQKLLEESPSVFVDDDLRRRMGEVAVKAAQSVDYTNAGTIEFLVDKDKNFYFLEMNTRLQVEHPVTELVTGVDIVKEQIRIARGRPLSRSQDQIQITGAAIECRINAEDPYNNFMPSIGMITAMTAPTGPGVRIDTGVTTGDQITPYYDSMISKLICWGDTRAEAILRMRRALSEYRILGLRTTIPFHQSLLDSPRFLGGQFDTAFVEGRFSIDEASYPRPEIAAILATLVAHRARQEAAQIVRRNERDVSNWKLASRWDRMHRRY
ncbi:MAG: acetyl-CoA carboxylase biotin carboxylase subunit [Anaerolineae bacterium]|nr:acetyl-CoA carboxylase biotin carboxylase subunit [Anaerolineae bacterium]